MSRRARPLAIACFLIPCVWLAQARPTPPAPAAPEIDANTFSIVAYDPARQEWGIAVASRALAVGAVVPWARAGVGAVATQARVNIAHGQNGLDLLAKGMSADEAL